MAKPLCVTGMVLVSTNATVQMISQPVFSPGSTNVKAGTLPVYEEGTTATFAVGSLLSVGGAPPGVLPTPGTLISPVVVTLNSSATNTQCDLKGPLLLGDGNNVPVVAQFMGTTPAVPSFIPTPYPNTVSVQISAAGQSAVLGT